MVNSWTGTWEVGTESLELRVECGEWNDGGHERFSVILKLVRTESGFRASFSFLVVILERSNAER